MRVGFMDVCAPPETKLGIDEFGFGFDGHLVRKWHQGADMYGRDWKVSFPNALWHQINWIEQRRATWLAASWI